MAVSRTVMANTFAVCSIMRIPSPSTSMFPPSPFQWLPYFPTALRSQNRAYAGHGRRKGDRQTRSGRGRKRQWHAYWLRRRRASA
jgi:hypothetical protein